MDLDEEIQDLIRKRPKYKISKSYGDNQGLAESAAFGRDRSIQQQESNLEQTSANTVSQAKDATASTSGLLNAIAMITGNKNNALRGLAQDEASIQNQKLQQVFGTNKDMAEEEDKEWNYNTNEPYQNQMNYLVQKKKNRDQTLFKILDTIGGFGIAAATGGLSNLFGGKGGQAGYSNAIQ